MVKRYLGGMMTGNTFSVNTSSASGFFNSSNHMQYKQANAWPIQYNRTPTIDYLVVAGGGSGGGWTYDGGGGGGGGLLTGSGISITGGTLTVNIGAGGTYTFNTLAPGSNSNISGLGITTVTSIGGGGGSSYNGSYINGGNGGSGGGGGGTGIGGTGTSGPPRQGYDGGSGQNGSRNAGGGGGGAGSAGSNGAVSAYGGKGGDGLTSSLLPSISSTTSNTIGLGTLSFTVSAGLNFVAGQAIRVYNSAGNYMWGTVNSYSGTTLSFNCSGFAGSGTYTSWTINQAFAGGGGGSTEQGAFPGGAGGVGGAGQGGGSQQGVTAGVANSGGGGGAGHSGSGVNGGSGVVIIRHASSYSQAFSSTGNPIIYTSGGYTIYTFTSSGSLTFL